MELGATVCLPRNPLCLVCPLADRCRARAEGTAAQLPVKLRKTAPVRIEGVLLMVRRARGQPGSCCGSAQPMPAAWRVSGTCPRPSDLPDARIGETFR